MKPFLDTNILVYAALSDDPRARPRRRCGCWRRSDGLSTTMLIVVQEAGCDTLYTEDVQHGRTIGELAIVNPFLEGAP